MNDLEGHSKSSELARFDMPFRWSVVTKSLSCTMSEIPRYHHFYSVTLTRPYVSIEQSNLRDTYVFRFVHILANRPTCYISEVWEIERF